MNLKSETTPDPGVGQCNNDHVTLQDSSDITAGVVKTQTELVGSREQRASRTTAGKSLPVQKSTGTGV